MKKLCILILICALCTITMGKRTASQLAAAKSRQAANTLKKAPKQTSTQNSAKTSSSSNPYAKYQSMDWGSAAEAAKNAGLDTSTGSAFDLAMNQKYNPGNYETLTRTNSNIGPWSAGYGSETQYGNESKSQPSSNRSKAQSIFNGVMGINTAEASDGKVLGASTSRPEAKPVNTGGIKGWIKEQALNLINYRNQANDFGRSKGIDVPFNTDWGISEILGIPKASIIQENTQVNPSFTKSQNPYDVLDRTNSNDVSLLNDIFSGNNAHVSNNEPNSIDWSTVNTENDRPVSNYSNNKRSNPVKTNDIFSPQASPFYQNVPDYSNNSSNDNGFTETPTPNTPVSRNENTVRQLLGNGYFSGGIFGNGAGASSSNMNSLNGASLGMDNQNDFWNQINPFYTPSAKAEGLPQGFNFNQQLNQQGFSGMGSQGLGEYSPNGNFTPMQPGNGGINQGNTGLPKIISNNMNQKSNQSQGMNEDEYIKKNFDGNYYDKQMSNAKKQLENLLESLNANYDQQQTEGTNTLNKQALANMQNLNSQFSFANADPNDEQRIQYQQRQQNDNATNLANFLSKLAASRNQDILTQKNQGLDTINQILQRKASARSQAAKDWNDYQNKMWDRNYKMSQLGNNKTKQQTAIKQLLSLASNMPSGGREFAQSQANLMGLGDISGYTPNGWENAYNPKFGKTGYQASGQVQQIMNELGVDEATAQKLIIQEINNGY